MVTRGDHRLPHGGQQGGVALVIRQRHPSEHGAARRGVDEGGRELLVDAEPAAGGKAADAFHQDLHPGLEQRGCPFAQLSRAVPLLPCLSGADPC